MIAARTWAGVALGTAPNRMVATPAAVGVAKLVAHPVGTPVAPPTPVVTLFSTGTATSTLRGPSAPHDGPPAGLLVVTQRMLGRFSVQGARDSPSMFAPGSAPEGIATNSVRRARRIAAVKSDSASPASQLMLTTRTPRAAAQSNAAAWTYW